MDFTYQTYRQFLQLAKTQGYQFLAFTDSQRQATADQYILLRHDVDFDIYKALKMAEIEAQEGVQSTYFFMITSSFYNLYHHHVIQVIQKIFSLGHSVGLHFDEKSCIDPQNVASFQQSLEDQKKVFEQIYKKPLEIISFHRPSELVVQKNVSVGVDHTYLNKFSTDIEYVSDSKRDFKGKDLLSYIESNNPKKMQVLIHPLWWNEDKSTIAQDFDQFIHDQQDHLRKEISNNSKVYDY